MNRRVFVLILLVVLVAAGTGWGGYRYFQSGDSDESETWEVITVRRGTLEVSISATGSIEPLTQAKLGFGVGGTLAEVLVEEGERVQAGQLLARLDTTDLEFQVAQAEASLELAKAQLAEVSSGPLAESIAASRAELEAARADYQRVLDGPSPEELSAAEADVARAQIALAQAQTEYDKIAWAGDVGAMPQAVALQQATIDYEQAKERYEQLLAHPTSSEVKAAAARVASAEAQLAQLLNTPTAEQIAVAQARVAQAQVALDQARSSLERASLTAPFAGTVARLDADVGEPLAPNQPFVLLVDDSQLHIRINVDEADIGQVAVGQQARITLDAFPNQELLGQVTAIAPTATVDAGVVVYQVTITLEPSQVPLRVGMTANAHITTQRRENVLLVPNRAVLIDSDTGRFFVEKLVAGQPTPTEVQTGLRGELMSEIVAGLREGDQIAVRRTSYRERLREMIGPPSSSQ